MEATKLSFQIMQFTISGN